MIGIINKEKIVGETKEYKSQEDWVSQSYVSTIYGGIKKKLPKKKGYSVVYAYIYQSARKVTDSMRSG